MLSLSPRDWLMDGLVSFFFYIYIYSQPNCIAYESECQRQVEIHTYRDIEENEELTLDYGFKTEDQDKIVCSCQSANCRRYLNWTEIHPKIFSLFFTFCLKFLFSTSFSLCYITIYKLFFFPFQLLVKHWITRTIISFINWLCQRCSQWINDKLTIDSLENWQIKCLNVSLDLNMPCICSVDSPWITSNTRFS